MVVRDSGGGKGDHKRSCPRLRTYRWIIRRHPISRAVLKRNLSRYANRDDLSKLKGARPLIHGQALPHFRPSSSFFRYRLSSLSHRRHRARAPARSIIISVVVVVVDVVVVTVVVRSGEKRPPDTCRPLAHPRGTTAVLSRPNPADDETLVYCTCGSPPRRQRCAVFSLCRQRERFSDAHGFASLLVDEVRIEVAQILLRVRDSPAK